MMYFGTDPCLPGEETPPSNTEQTAGTDFNSSLCFPPSLPGIVLLFTVFSGLIFTSTTFYFLGSGVADLK